MQIEITKQIEIKEIIDVEFPYYYKQILTSASVIYGKILEDYIYPIHESERVSGRIIFELQKYKMSDSSHCYFNPMYKSSKEEYEVARQRALEFFDCL